LALKRKKKKPKGSSRSSKSRLQLCKRGVA